MPIQKTEGVLLKKRDLRQTSLIVTFFTKDFGKIHGVIKGVRGERASSQGIPQLFSLNQIVFYDKRKSDLFIVSQCDLKDFFSKIRHDFDKITTAMYLIDLVDNFSEPQEPNPALFSLLNECLRLLSGDSSPKRVARIFEIKLLELLGLMPIMDMCSICGKDINKEVYFSNFSGGTLDKECSIKAKNAIKVLPGTIQFISHISRLGLDRVSRIKVSSDVGKELEKLLRSFIDFQLNKPLRSVEFIRKVS